MTERTYTADEVGAMIARAVAAAKQEFVCSTGLCHYKAQRQWVGLTDEAIWSEYQTLWSFHPAEEPRLAKDIAKFYRAIEAKLKEKNA